ncbi:MAG: hypothetical protein JSW11_17100 [Candidatus Heimdallarchaeota archaeon]|nr:MAG: hypothetical protein JSW11_17100 [Candidatus Heimdallarchaeota archaeon]
MRFIPEFLEYNKKLIEFEHFLALSRNNNSYRNYNFRQLRKIFFLCHKIRVNKYHDIEQDLADILTLIFKMKQKTQGKYCLSKVKKRIYEKGLTRPELQDLFSSRLPLLQDKLEFYQQRLESLVELEREGSYLEYLLNTQIYE